MIDDPTPFDARYVDPRVRLAMRILEFEQTRVPSIDDVAARVGLSLFRLAHLFSAQVGESCATYSRRIRLENSNNQLMHDPMPLDVVASSFGYASQATYTRAFSRHFGMPPLRYAATVLGQTQADYAASQLGPADVDRHDAPLLIEQVRLVERMNCRALARRFYGHDTADHWRRFLEELPPGLLEGAQLAGMAYDSPRVTPSARWRYDCAIVSADLEQAQTGFDPKSRLMATCWISGARPWGCSRNGCRSIANIAPRATRLCIGCMRCRPAIPFLLRRPSASIPGKARPR